MVLGLSARIGEWLLGLVNRIFVWEDILCLCFVFLGVFWAAPHEKVAHRCARAASVGSSVSRPAALWAGMAVAW